jgi:hypothetical protein
MNENVPAVFLVDEAVPLLVVEPFNRTNCQSVSLLFDTFRAIMPPQVNDAKPSPQMLYTKPEYYSDSPYAMLNLHVKKKTCK